MSKLLILPAIAALVVNLYGDAKQDAIADFLRKTAAAEAAKHPGREVAVKNIRFLNSKQVDKRWTGFFVSANIDVHEMGEAETIPYRGIFFTDGEAVTSEIGSPLAGEIMADLVPTAGRAMYDASHHIAGAKNAKHKLVLFSDPLCPGCQHLVPKIIDKVKKNPGRYALYFYHYPLEQIHPESPDIVKGMIALHRMGKKDVVEKVYRKGVESAVDLEKMYGGYTVTKKDIEHYKKDLEWVEKLAVRGTPSLYLDGDLDVGGKKFFEMK